MFGGRGMGGGSGAGGGMLRTFGRAVTRAGVTGGGGLQEPFSSATVTATATTASNVSSTTTTFPTSRPTHKSKSSSHLSLYSSASPFSSFNSPKSAASSLPTWRYVSQGDECEWVCVDQIEDERSHGFFDDYALGPVPSDYEVQTACLCSTTMDLSWIGWSLLGINVIQERYFIMDPTVFLMHSIYCGQSHQVQRMVKSLSSDKAVWDAVLNNDVVRKLRESFYADEDNSPPIPNGTCDDDSEKATNIVRLIFENAKMKIKEVIEKLSKVVTELFQAQADGKIAGEATNPFNEKLRSSFLLSIMVLLVVVVTRAQKA
ncbi:Uncharacterized conserved protein (UCP012943) [Quillaja saponaria]|uniref:Uncharacterized conserved protein (UCP012943) n=1 Tax=Quillaja saponaria TaxID=32244 RepID=A0AAD7LAN6_QUISA|nr:Uncharacterized conserved protein (UCP012943) [Quillaja saponaria]